MEKSVVITYETLYEILRIEKSKAELRQLDRTFFSDVSKYLNGKKRLLDAQQDKSTPFSLELQKTKKQYENVQRIVRELYEKRENKIVQMAILSSRLNDENIPANMLPEEETFYKDILKLLNKYRKEILFDLLERKISENGKADTKLVRFLNPMPKFVGDDLKTYGPYEEGDVAEFSIKVANLLVRKKRAAEV